MLDFNGMKEKWWAESSNRVESEELLTTRAPLYPWVVLRDLGHLMSIALAWWRWSRVTARYFPDPY
jgi:hypothetical protein